jgi:hypothetical protein
MPRMKVTFTIMTVMHICPIGIKSHGPVYIILHM